MKRDTTLSLLFTLLIVFISFLFVKWFINGGYSKSEPFTFWVLFGIVISLVLMVVCGLINSIIANSKGSLKIIFDRPKYYNLGETIAGGIQCKLNVPIEGHSGVDLSLEAISSQRGRQDIVCFRHNSFLPLSEHLFNARSNEYYLPFSIILPDQKDVTKSADAYKEGFEEFVPKKITGLLGNISERLFSMAVLGNLNWYIKARIDMSGVDLYTEERLSVNTNILSF